MKVLFPNVKNEKRIKYFSIATTSLLLLFVIHCIGEIIIQFFVKSDSIIEKPLNIPCLGMLFGSSIFSTLLCGLGTDAQLLMTVNSIITIVFAISLVVSTMSLVKRKLWALFVVSIMYIIDSFILIPTIIIDCSRISNIVLSPIDYVLMILFHLIGLFLIVVSFLFFKLDENQLINDNNIKIDNFKDK